MSVSTRSSRKNSRCLRNVRGWFQELVNSLVRTTTTFRGIRNFHPPHLTHERKKNHARCWFRSLPSWASSCRQRCTCAWRSVTPTSTHILATSATRIRIHLHCSSLPSRSSNHHRELRGGVCRLGGYRRYLGHDHLYRPRPWSHNSCCG